MNRPESGTVYSGASPLQANMRIPVRPCPVALSLSRIFSPTVGPDSGSASEPGPTHAERIKIIFTRFATNPRRVEIEKSQVQEFRIDEKKY